MAPGTSFDLRSLHIVVAHPRDHDGEILIRSLQRLGGQIEQVWPAPDRQEERADLVFYLLGQQSRDLLSLGFEATHSALIVIVDPSEALSAQSFGKSTMGRPAAILLTGWPKGQTVPCGSARGAAACSS